MGLDIRVPIGWLFTILGGLLASFGLISNHLTYTWAIATNINLIWGVVLLVFGVLMLVLSKRAMAVARSKTDAPGGQRAS